jgi:hypothetical protein
MANTRRGAMWFEQQPRCLSDVCVSLHAHLALALQLCECPAVSTQCNCLMQQAVVVETSTGWSFTAAQVKPAHKTYTRNRMATEVEAQGAVARARTNAQRTSRAYTGPHDGQRLPHAPRHCLHSGTSCTSQNCTMNTLHIPHHIPSGERRGLLVYGLAVLCKDAHSDTRTCLYRVDKPLTTVRYVTWPPCEVLSGQCMRVHGLPLKHALQPAAACSQSMQPGLKTFINLATERTVARALAAIEINWSPEGSRRCRPAHGEHLTRSVRRQSLEWRVARVLAAVDDRGKPLTAAVLFVLLATTEWPRSTWIGHPS